MRYLAQRAVTGEWIDRDLPLSAVERTRDLSGPGGITATIAPELRHAFHSDGLRVLEEWGTYIYAEDDNGRIRRAGIFTDASYDEGSLVATCPGFTSYAQGYIYGTERNWGPDPSSSPPKARPDPLVIVQDLWDYIQAQPDSDLGLQIVGTLASTVRVGDNEEPFRLRSYEIPDIGQTIDGLAGQTPFDYVEEHAWADEKRMEVDHVLRLGWPRLGKRRADLRFALGENIIVTVPAASTAGVFANDILGVGNGEGSTMVRARSTIRDGRLRRTRVVTDKTLQQGPLDKLVSQIREASASSIDITTVAIGEHPNAPIASIDPGDDIFIQTLLPTYGEIQMWVRVLSIAEDDTGNAVLTTSRSSNFLYSSTVEVS